MIKIEFETNNAAFHEATHDSFGGEVARILRHLADGIDGGAINDRDADVDFGYPINNVNGNKIGTLTITAD